MVTICSSLRTRMARHEFGGWLAEDEAPCVCSQVVLTLMRGVGPCGQ